ncbi:MAG TPA: choice-of-anchor D domain-containing protein, partial [Myxococcaceae bacterium]|nr:choice-of-anchor D domain-containing protein [Myxococcaceae bacterium]
MNPHRVFIAFVALMAGNALAADPLEPVLLAQFSAPVTPMAIEGNASGETVYLRASSAAGTCGANSTYALEVEVRPAGTPFSGVPTHTSAVIAKPSCVIAEYPLTAIGGLVPGAYQWRARENVDGVRSRWVAFNGGLPAFRVPEIALSSWSVAFGDVRTGTISRTRTVEIFNLTQQVVTIAAPAVTGPFRIVGGPSTPLTLDPGGKAGFTVAAAPLTAGTHRGSFTAESAEASSPLRADLAVSGTEPRLQIDSAPVDFGEAVVGAGSQSRSVVVRNVGTAILTIAGPSITGPFAFAQLAGVRMAPGAAHSFTLYYAPNSAGAHASTLSIDSDDPGGPRELLVSGSAIAQAPPPSQPSLSLSTAARDFGSVAVGQSGALSLTVSNGGGAALNVTALSLDGAQASEFAIDAVALPFSIAPGAAAQLAVRFAPAGVGARAATLRIQSDAYPSGTASVPLSGWGHGAKLSMSSTSLEFGAVNVGGTVTRTLEMLNEGSAVAAVSALSFHGAAA